MSHQEFNRNFTKLREYFLCAKKTKITIYSTILLPELLSSSILESTPEHNQRCLHSASTRFILNIDADYVLGYSPKWGKMSHGLFYQSPCYVYIDRSNIIAVYGRVRELSDFIKKYLNLFSEDKRRSYGFGATWGWVIKVQVNRKLLLTLFQCSDVFPAETEYWVESRVLFLRSSSLSLTHSKLTVGGVCLRIFSPSRKTEVIKKLMPFQSGSKCSDFD